MDSGQRGFTIVELLIVIAIVAVLAVGVVLIINPAQLLMQSRDSNRISALSAVDSAIGFAQSKGLSLGTPNIAYVSIPDPTLTGNATSNCASLGLPAISSLTYQCASPANVTKIDGTGWIPVALNGTAPGTALGALPLDPVNTTSSGEYYVYTTNGTGYELIAKPEAAKNASSTSFAQGSGGALLPTGGGQDIWVADYSNNRVEEFDTNGNFISQFGSSGTGNGQFTGPDAINIDSSGNIYVADFGNNRIEKFGSNENYISQFSATGGMNTHLYGPSGIAFDGNGNIYVSDWVNNRAVKFDSNGNYISQFATSTYRPGDIAISASTGNIYLTQCAPNPIAEFSPSGAPIAQFGEYGRDGSQFLCTPGFSIDSAGNLYMADGENQAVEKFDGNGTILLHFGSAGNGNGQFATSSPNDSAEDASGNIYLVDPPNNRIEKFDSGGHYIMQFGSLGSSTGKFSAPTAIFIK